jgi:hypothetical protein
MQLSMEHKISTQLSIIEKSIKWIKETDSMHGAKGYYAYLNLINFRHKLNKKKFALEDNPAAAIYGESQAGKSYLVSSLLREESKPFKIYDGKGNEYDFKQQINPRGNEMESTSVVTRFSTMYKINNTDYPIIAKLLSPTDLILIICEAYFNNVKTNKSTNFEDLKNKIDSFEQKYSIKEDCQKYISEDNILFDIKDYFIQNFSSISYNNFIDAHFFEKISAIVAKIAPDEWKNVFSLLWNFNPQLTKLFDDLIAQYKTIEFANTIYLSIEAVLREKGTLLDVSRLDEIYEPFKGQEPDYCAKTSILYNDEKITQISKSYLCALIAELIFVLPETIKNSKKFLDKIDLLDFPGIRRFETINEDNISNDSLTKLLRRGRVDYLFNKYSEVGRINTLLFCQKHTQSNQSVMPEKLNRWIGNMIGKTSEEREEFRSVIPPIFLISTWFNKDLEFNFSEDKPENQTSLSERWNQRFVRTLANEILKVDTYQWLINWTTSKKNFQNIYLLRDFEKSSETNSQIFKGYNENGREEDEIIPSNYTNFRVDLRQSFLNFEFVKQHFENPAQSWDMSASINNDGAQLIINHLTIVAESLSPARLEKARRELIVITEGILNELKKYYHDSDSDIMLQNAKSVAGALQLKFDSAFGGPNIKHFGKMMKEIMLDKSIVFEFYEKKINDIERRDIVNMDKYSNIRMAVRLEPNDNAGNLERLRVEYEKPAISEHYTIEDLKKEFVTEGIDLDELFDWLNTNYEQVRSKAGIWAEELFEYWLKYWLQNNNHMIGNILYDMLTDIKDMYKKLFSKLCISKIIEEKIRLYMIDSRSSENMHEMIADISTEIINNFIKSVGCDYFDKSDLDDLKLANEKNSLGLVLEHDELDFIENSKEGAAKLITLTTHLPELWNQNPLPIEIKRLPNYCAYIRWRDALKTGFVRIHDIKTYDIHANNRLKEIIDQNEKIKY